MRYLLVIFLLLAACCIFAVNVEQCSTFDNRVSVKLNQIKSAPDLTNSDPNLMISSQTYALPYQQASLQVYSMQWSTYSKSGAFIKTDTEFKQDAVFISHTFTFREMNGITVNMKNQIEDGDNYKVLNSVEFDVIGNSPIVLPQSVSSAYIKSYEKLAANYNTSYLRNLPIGRPKLLIISHSSLTPFLVNFVSWKKSKGYEVYVLNSQDVGTNANAIRESIRNHYNQYKCDYLLILGDVTGSFAIPTNVYTSPTGDEQDADDNFYTMLTGDDYFPEMLVGRFSFSDISQYLTLTNKTIFYEKTPDMMYPNWMKRALVVAGNYSESLPFPVTPIQMSLWLRDKLLSTGYTQVDTVFCGTTYPGTPEIITSIENGVQYISYRGWGAADGWHYPSFHSENLEPDVMDNGAKMPIVYSIVCNTGDFSNLEQNPCFGEKWMLMGTLEVPNGCVAFVGPSDLHTKTNLNNTISTGIYSSIFDDGERNFGASVLAGKIELYKNYPNNLASNDLVAFYFHVYNILSDPTLNMWMLIPQTIPESVITEGTSFSQSDSDIRIQASYLNGAIVTGTKDNINYTYTTIQNGAAVLPINPEVPGVLTVTISKENYVPLVDTLSPSLPPSIGIISNSMANQLINAGQTYSVTISVKNFSTSALNGIVANLNTSPSDLLTIQNPSQTITNLAAQGTTNLTYSFTVNGNVSAHKIIRFDLAFPNQTSQSSFELTTGGAEFAIVSSSGVLNIGSTSTMTFTVKNTGTFTIQNASVNVQPVHTAAVISNPTANIGNLDIGQTASFQIPITVLDGCYNGRNIPFYFTFSNPSAYNSSCYYSLTAGNPTVSDPTGPDQYGYFAYGSNDLAYEEHPVYNWVDIDPNNGGEGDVHLIMDDGSYTVDLPFTFKYYGRDYNQMTICSNGWVSFVPTWMTDFNNLYIPAALGPYAMLAPYWDDLKGMKTGAETYNDMRICNWYDAVNTRFIVEWNDAYSQYTIESPTPSLEKFQIILYPISNSDGEVVYQYHTIDNPALSSNYCTVGIENHLQNDGLTYTFANIYPVTAAPLQSGLAVKFTKSPPDNYVANEDYIQSLLPFSINQNTPNPFNPETSISFNMIKKGSVSLEIYNLKGQKIRTLINTDMVKGQHQIVWNGKNDYGMDSGSGVYLYKMTSGSYSQTKKMILMR